MIEPIWLTVPLIVIGLIHVATVGIGLWIRRSVESRVGERRADTVVCPDCGTTNEWGYRFCRACVCELPGPSPYTQPSRESRWATLR